MGRIERYCVTCEVHEIYLNETSYVLASYVFCDMYLGSNNFGGLVDKNER